mmetsp:Transcript_49530/g.105950  ORF Transcript_49530/g.105950 Transcript_49530/m.105950 type:complete len:265 (+) Transcript_49530:391-1185(+)
MGVVRLATDLEPVVPVMAPLAACLQFLREACAARLVAATAIIIVAIMVAHLRTRELRHTTTCKDALARSGDLNVEAVLPADIIADVGDLDYHCLPNKLGVCATPIITIRVVCLVDEVERIALATILVAVQATDAADSGCCKAHAQAAIHDKRLVVAAGGRRAALANRHYVRVSEDIASGSVTCSHRLGDVTFVAPGAARLATIPVARGPSASVPALRGRKRCCRSRCRCSWIWCGHRYQRRRRHRFRYGCGSWCKCGHGYEACG